MREELKTAQPDNGEEVKKPRKIWKGKGRTEKLENENKNKANISE